MGIPKKLRKMHPGMKFWAPFKKKPGFRDYGISSLTFSRQYSLMKKAMKEAYGDYSKTIHPAGREKFWTSPKIMQKIIQAIEKNAFQNVYDRKENYLKLIDSFKKARMEDKLEVVKSYVYGLAVRRHVSFSKAKQKTINSIAGIRDAVNSIMNQTRLAPKAIGTTNLDRIVLQNVNDGFGHLISQYQLFEILEIYLKEI